MSPAAPNWVEQVRASDLARQGVELHGSPPDTLRAHAADFDVDLEQVTACLRLLMAGPHVLYVGAPVAMAAYSVRTRHFRVSFDCELAPDLAVLDLPAAGVWLAVAASEVGELPAVAPHWAVMTMDPRGPSGLNVSAAAMLRRYASDRASLDPYELYTAHAFWSCASHCLDGR